MAEQTPSVVQPISAVQRTGNRLEKRVDLDDGPLIVLSKLHPPAPRRSTVGRKELLARLAEENSAKLILVVAPAGWGKTSLLGEWCSACDTERMAWLSVDQGDNDPVCFWAHVIAALNKVSPEINADARQLLTAPSGKSANILLPRLINDFELMPARVTLIVDDYDQIRNKDIHECVEYLIEHMPPSLRLVLATRSGPALPLARLRARGEMTEIRIDDLRFTEAETAGLLNETLHLGLSSEDIRLLCQRTEGWAAGLYLAGLSLSGHERPDAPVSSFAGDDRQIVDYLVAEVLDVQPAHIRSFLLRTGVLDRLSARLCDAVTGEGGSQRILEEIERTGLFIVPLDTSRRWYRYHTLFAETLRRELDRSEPRLAQLLHRRASEWYRQEGSIAEAVGHAMLASDLADARELIATRCIGYFNEGLAGTAESWLSSLPPEMVAEDSRLCLANAWIASHLGRLDEVEPWLRAGDTATRQGALTDGPGSIESAVCSVRSHTSYLLGDLAGAEAASRRAVELAAEGIGRCRAVALAALGASLCWQGRDTESLEILKPIAEPLHAPVDNLARLWALGCLAAITLRQGQQGRCDGYLQRAADLMAQHGLGMYREAATAILASADLLERRGELRAAEEAALSGLELAQRSQARLETALAWLCLARVRAGSGAEAAAACLSAAREIIGMCAAPGIVTELATSTARLTGQHAPAPRSGRRPGGGRPDGLTGREAQVLRLLAAGKTNSEIAADLVVSVHTVERHLQNAYRKLGVRNRGQAAAYIARTALLGHL